MQLNMNDGYWITAGTLVSRHLDNLFFAGRGFSATEPAMASARVIGTLPDAAFFSLHIRNSG